MNPPLNILGIADNLFQGGAWAIHLLMDVSLVSRHHHPVVADAAVSVRPCGRMEGGESNVMCGVIYYTQSRRE